MYLNNKSLKDCKLRFLLKKKELFFLLLKVLLYNQRNPLWFRSYLQNFIFMKNYCNISKSKVVNRCILTGRGRSVLRFCKLSRIKFKELSLQGKLFGVRKAVW